VLEPGLSTSQRRREPLIYRFIFNTLSDSVQPPGYWKYHLSSTAEIFGSGHQKIHMGTGAVVGICIGALIGAAILMILLKYLLTPCKSPWQLSPTIGPENKQKEC
jgi:hypothetical protein